jgi:transcriptional antiterminator NusG
MQESDDSNSKANDADTDAENVEVQPTAEEDEEAQKKKDTKANKNSEDSGELLVMESETTDVPVEESVQVGDSDDNKESDDSVSLIEPETKEVTEVTAVSELKDEPSDVDEQKEQKESEEQKEQNISGEPNKDDEEKEDSEKTLEPEQQPTPSADETELSLTDDIGDSEDIPKEGGSFLELDTDTRHKMDEIEESERLAEEAERAAEEDAELFETGIFAVKTSIGHEKMVANWLAIRARKRKMDVFAILSPPKLRGYLLLEGVKNKEALQDMIKGVQHARSVVDGTSSIEEIEHFLTPKPLVSGIEEGDVVEIIAGPFKGEKAKVTQIDESKEEITVELFEAMVSIPVTIRGDHVRILEKEGK